MRSIIKIWPVILVVLVLLNMPSLKGLTNVQLDRSIQFQLDSLGKLTIIGLDDGITGAVNLPHQGQPFGTLINNFNSNIYLDIELEVELIIAEPTSSNIHWTSPRFAIGDDNRLNFGNVHLNSPKTDLVEWLPLEPGEELTISLDQRSDFVVRGQGSLEYALGVIRIAITGYTPEGEEIFYLHPGSNNSSDDFLKQYFYKGELPQATPVFNYEIFEADNLPITEPGVEASESFSSESQQYAEQVHSESSNNEDREDLEETLESLEDYNKTDSGDEEPDNSLTESSLPESIHPVEELDSFNLIGEIKDLQHMPENLAAYDSWYKAEDSNLETLLCLIFDEPQKYLTGNQTIQVLARRTDHNSNIPVLDIELHQNGEFITYLAKDDEVKNVEGEVLSYTFDAEILQDLTGANLEIWLHGHYPGGLDSPRNTVEFGAVAWLLQAE